MRFVIIALLLSVVLVACSQEGPVCSEPYILNEGKCCLDNDADGACDPVPLKEDETGFDCSLCPPKFVTETEEVIVYKYVCMNGSIMDTEGQCEERVVSNAHLFTVNDEEDPAFEKFSARPACRGKYKAAELHIVPAEPPRFMTVQVMDEPDTSFRDLYVLNGSNQILDDEYVYIGFCEYDCEETTDAQLTPEKAYLVRTVMTVNETTVRTNEILLDPTPEGKYSEQRC